MGRLDELGEEGVIERLAALVGRGRGVRVGIGDDAAVVTAPDGDWVLTSDPVIEGVHFTVDAGGRRVGCKAAGRVLSDMAAMGGAAPCWVLVNLVAPPSAGAAFLEDAYRGISERLSMFGACVVGGDTARGPVLEMHLFGVGRLPSGTALLRSGGKNGDKLYVTGELGGSIQGKQYDFLPRVREGAWLREGGWATAMIDISDGLLSEVYHLAHASSTGAILWPQAIPIAEAARTLDDGLRPLDHALGDGEDFELLFTVPAAKQSAFEKAWSGAHTLSCRCIGELTDDTGHVLLAGETGTHVADPGGFRHY